MDTSWIHPGIAVLGIGQENGSAPAIGSNQVVGSSNLSVGPEIPLHFHGHNQPGDCNRVLAVGHEIRLGRDLLLFGYYREGSRPFACGKEC